MWCEHTLAPSEGAQRRWGSGVGGNIHTPDGQEGPPRCARTGARDEEAGGARDHPHHGIPRAHPVSAQAGCGGPGCWGATAPGSPLRGTQLHSRRGREVPPLLSSLEGRAAPPNATRWVPPWRTVRRGNRLGPSTESQIGN